MTTTSGSDSNSVSSGSGDTSQGTEAGTSSAGGSEGAQPATTAASAFPYRELSGCTLKMYGGRPAKSGKEKYGGWTMCSEGVRKGAVVYSFGIGSDVSFDYAVLRRGAKVQGHTGPEGAQSLQTKSLLRLQS